MRPAILHDEQCDPVVTRGTLESAEYLVAERPFTNARRIRYHDANLGSHLLVRCFFAARCSARGAWRGMATHRRHTCGSCRALEL